jgi:hypothetical protein
MKKLLLPVVAPMLAMAMIMVPAAANAAQCRNSATGKFAKCGTPGAVPASQYVAKSKAKSATMAKTTSTMPMKPAAAPTTGPGSSLKWSLLKPKPKATPTAGATPLAKTSTKIVRCKTVAGKFVKCGTPGAKPA